MRIRPPSPPHARRVLVVTPTRELAAQCHTMLGRLTQFCAGISAALITGGAKNGEREEAELRTSPCRRAARARARANTPARR